LGFNLVFKGLRLSGAIPVPPSYVVESETVLLYFYCVLAG